MTRYLFPNKHKKWALPVFLLSMLASIHYLISNPHFSIFDGKAFAVMFDHLLSERGSFKIIENNLYDEFLAVVAIVSGVIAAFSREEQEDEFIMKLRLESLAWATLANYAILLFCVVFIYGELFLNLVMLNLMTLLLLFILKFNWQLLGTKRLMDAE